MSFDKKRVRTWSDTHTWLIYMIAELAAERTIARVHPAYPPDLLLVYATVDWLCDKLDIPKTSSVREYLQEMAWSYIRLRPSPKTEPQKKGTKP